MEKDLKILQDLLEKLSYNKGKHMAIDFFDYMREEHKISGYEHERLMTHYMNYCDDVERSQIP